MSRDFSFLTVRLAQPPFSSASETASTSRTTSHSHHLDSSRAKLNEPALTSVQPTQETNREDYNPLELYSEDEPVTETTTLESPRTTAEEEKPQFLIPSFTDRPMYSLSSLYSGLGHLAFSVETPDDKPSLSALIELEDGEQFLLETLSTSFSGLTKLPNGSLQFDLSSGRSLKRALLFTAPFASGVLTLQSLSLGWSVNHSLSRTSDSSQANAVGKLYQVDGCLVVREMCYGYANPRVLANAHSFSKIAWLNDFTCVR